MWPRLLACAVMSQGSTQELTLPVLFNAALAEPYLQPLRATSKSQTEIHQLLSKQGPYLCKLFKVVYTPGPLNKSGACLQPQYTVASPCQRLATIACTIRPRMSCKPAKTHLLVHLQDGGCLIQIHAGLSPPVEDVGCKDALEWGTHALCATPQSPEPEQTGWQASTCTSARSLHAGAMLSSSVSRSGSTSKAALFSRSLSFLQAAKRGETAACT